MEGPVEDVNKAWKMANAGKNLRDQARIPSITEEARTRLNRTADREEDNAGKDFEDEKRDSERRLHKIHEAQKDDKAVINMPESFRAEELISIGRGLCSALKRRDGDMLSPLIEPEEIRKLSIGLNMLETGVQQKLISDVLQALDIISKALDGIGNAQTSRNLREDDASLGKVIFYLNNLKDASMLLRRSLPVNEDLTRKLNRISSIAEQKGSFVAARRRVLKSY